MSDSEHSIITQLPVRQQIADKNNHFLQIGKTTYIQGNLIYKK